MSIPAWLDSLRADAVFSARRLYKHKVTSGAAILSAGLAMGACMAAFQLMDGLFLRPLPISRAQDLYVVARPAANSAGDGWEHMRFRALRAALMDRAATARPDLIAVSFVEQTDVSPGFSANQAMEKANLQYVSGDMFRSFGVEPAVGRVISEDDERGGRPVAVLAWDYWRNRFGSDPGIAGKTMTVARKYGVGSEIFEIIGVARKGFMGTEPGTPTDVFVPAMMHPFVNARPAGVFRIFAHLPPGAAPAPVREHLDSILHALNEQDRTKFPYPRDQKISLVPAAAGISGMQRNYGAALGVLGLLAGLALFIACANIANLMTAQAIGRAREMATRFSIGAGRSRLIQLVLVESALVVLMAAAVGVIVASESAAFVIARINPPDNPARFSLAADYRVFGAGSILVVGVIILLGLAPALRASAMAPAGAASRRNDPRARGRSPRLMIAAQTAFCFLVVFVGGLFLESFLRLSHQTYGFPTEDLVALDTVTPRDEPPSVWRQVAEDLRAIRGVESVGISEWPLLDGNGYRLNDISIEGGPPTETVVRFLTVSPGWIGTMKIPLIEGTDLRADETETAMVNREFVRRYFNARTALGRWIQAEPGGGWGHRFRIVGVIGDTPYKSVRDPILPLVLIPYRGSWHVETFVARLARLPKGGGPATSAAILRDEISRARPDFRVTRIRTQEGMLEAQTLRERLLATLGPFFAVVSLLLSGIGLYGMLDYSVRQRRREIGIRMALGERPGGIVRRITFDIVPWTVAGGVAGLVAVAGLRQQFEPLLYRAKAYDWSTVSLPMLALAMTAIVAGAPPVWRAIRSDPARVLRSE